jgi:hypothetical protein
MVATTIAAQHLALSLWANLNVNFVGWAAGISVLG